MKRLIILTIFFISVLTTQCIAEPLDEYTRTLGIELGFETSYISYKEPNVMKERGMMYGIKGSLTYRPLSKPSPYEINKQMYRIEGRFSYGEVDYKNSGELEGIPDFILEIRGLAGYDIIKTEATLLTPYYGIGYRYLNDDSSGMTSTTGAKGYERESNYFYSPLGIEFITKSKNNWSIGATIEYDYFWRGVQKSHLSDADPGFNNLENDQHDGYGIRGAIRFQKKGERVDFVIEPFIRYWSIDKSEEENVTYTGVLIGYGYEPKNHSTEIGINFAAMY